MVEARDPFGYVSENLYKRTVKGVKVAIPGILLDEGLMSSESMSDYLFDQVGGFELLSSARTTTIASPLNNTPSFIKDSGINFSRDSVVSASSTIQSSFSNNINLKNYIPQPDVSLWDQILQEYVVKQVVSIGTDNIITILVENIKLNYLVEIRFLYGEKSNGTIYSGSDN